MILINVNIKDQWWSAKDISQYLQKLFHTSIGYKTGRQVNKAAPFCSKVFARWICFHSSSKRSWQELDLTSSGACYLCQTETVGGWKAKVSTLSYSVALFFKQANCHKLIAPTIFVVQEHVI